MVELKPCPFCGGEAGIYGYTDKTGDVLVRVRCLNEWCRGHNNYWYSERDVTDAVDAWNQRAERTCKNIGDPKGSFLCSSCGWGDYAPPGLPLKDAKFCPNCRAKVVD